MDSAKRKQGILISRIILALIILALLGAGTFYTFYRWNTSLNETEQKAVQLADIAEAGISKSLIASLNGDASDLDRIEYKELKKSLVSMVNPQNNIRFSYVFVQKGEKVYFLADSEPVDSPDYSPPGQEYWEVDDVLLNQFQSHKTTITEPTSDRWGTWVSALVPMHDMNTGEIVAVFGIDFPVDAWYGEASYHAIQAALICLCVIAIIIILYYAIAKNIALGLEKKKLETTSQELLESEMLFRTVLEQAPIGIAVIRNNSTVYINPKFEAILGRTREQIAALHWSEFTHPEDVNADLELFAEFKAGKNDGYTLIKRYIRGDGSHIWANMIIAPLMLDNMQGNHLCIIEDISDQISVDMALKESERSKAVLLSNIPGMAYRCNYDKDWTMHFVSEGCYSLTGYTAENLIHNKDLSFNDIIAPEYRNTLWLEWERILREKQPFRYEYEIVTATGHRKWVLELGQGIFDSAGKAKALEGIIIDISDLKEKERQIQYMLDHDHLTGIYNRRYYEEALKKLDCDKMLPLCLLLVDINGVRLINDAFGYAEGDRLIKDTARMLQDCCGSADILTRVGGDEFGLLLPNTDNAAAFKAMNTIQKACETYNKNNSSRKYRIDLSIGYAIKDAMEQNINEVAKAADEYLRNQKLLNSNSFHSQLISSIMATLYEKSGETEEHSKRLAVISRKIGERLNVPQKELNELELFAMLHDIGKVGIDDVVLKKPEALTDDEWIKMKTHAEIGYRIAKASSELAPIAEYIFTHHERWDGAGYPQGLKGEDIPLLSRILSVADAFDSMTNDRSYRKAMTFEAAVQVIVKNAGIQFDPKVVEAFVTLVAKNEI